ncbi:MAG: molybdenum cofactor biosynthesis protein MoaE [Phycisphaerales bacterium]|nr:molybdenum cofactor biosynthesis protein MoaE [Phycisphaerales bacterium]
MARTPAPVLARIIDSPLTRDAERAELLLQGWPHAFAPAGNSVARTVGAVLRFEGIVRRGEPDPSAGGTERELLALEYQAYDPMAERELRRIALDIVERHALSSLVALHSRGRVGVGEVSFLLIMESPHRAEALAAMTLFIDMLKQDVPIWKKPIWR